MAQKARSGADRDSRKEPEFEAYDAPQSDAAEGPATDDGVERLDEFEAGIAAIFAALRDEDGPQEVLEPGPVDNGATLVILSELNRLWQHSST